MPLHQALFLEPSPGGTKFALSEMGKMAEDLRLPITPVGEDTRTAVRVALRHAGLMN